MSFSARSIKAFKQRFSVVAAQKGSAFVKSRRRDLDDIFSVQQERTVNQDNTAQLDNRVFQITKTRWRNTLAGTTVLLLEHLDGSVTIHYGPHRIAAYAPDQLPVQAPKKRGTPRQPYPKTALSEGGMRGRIGLRQQGIWIAPFSVSPTGGKPGHRRLRCAAAQARRRPKAERYTRSGPVRNRYDWTGLRPGPRRLTLYGKADISLANKSGHLDKLPTSRPPRSA
jgi:hypothetical protein